MQWFHAIIELQIGDAVTVLERGTALLKFKILNRESGLRKSSKRHSRHRILKSLPKISQLVHYPFFWQLAI